MGKLHELRKKYQPAPDKDLTWRDCLRRIARGWSGAYGKKYISGVLQGLMDFYEDHQHTRAMYARIDNNKDGRVTNKDVMIAQKDAYKRWKMKH